MYSKLYNKVIVVLKAIVMYSNMYNKVMILYSKMNNKVKLKRILV